LIVIHRVNWHSNILQMFLVYRGCVEGHIGRLLCRIFSVVFFSVMQIYKFSLVISWTPRCVDINNSIACFCAGGQRRSAQYVPTLRSDCERDPRANFRPSSHWRSPISQVDSGVFVLLHCSSFMLWSVPVFSWWQFCCCTTVLLHFLEIKCFGCKFAVNDSIVFYCSNCGVIILRI